MRGLAVNLYICCACAYQPRSLEATHLASLHILDGGGLCTTGANLYLCARNAEHLAQVAEECKKSGAESVTTMSVCEERISSV